MKLSKAKREELCADIRKLAQEMAESGLYADCLSIEIALLGQGYDPEAKTALRHDITRDMLNRVCLQAKKTAGSS